MRPTDRAALFLMAILALATSGACGDGAPPGTNSNSQPECDHDGICDPGESRPGCPDCINPTCSLESITGTRHDYLVAELFLPDSNLTARQNGVDLDGDGAIDNKLGQIIALFSSAQTDLNGDLNYGIQTGQLIVITRLIVDAFPTDELVITQVLPGAIHDDLPIFDGSDEVEIAPEADQRLFLCGELSGGDLWAGPSDLQLTLPLPDNPLTVTLRRSQLVGPVTETGWTDVMLGGGLTPEEVESKVLPSLAGLFNDAIQDNPTGDTATTVGPLFNGQCDESLCPEVTNGQGECAEEDPPVITVTELRCNALLSAALAPDIDTDGDGEEDLLSLGLRIVRAVPVTVVGN